MANQLNNQPTYDKKPHIIKLFNPNSEPFGLLSNHANIKLTINNINWCSVTQYIYINMFKPEESFLRQTMQEHISRNPFPSYLKIKADSDHNLYNKELIKGLRSRLEDKSTRLLLFQTRGKTLYFNDEKVLSLLNNLRYDPNISINQLTNEEISNQIVLDVIAKIENILLDQNTHKNTTNIFENEVSIPDNSTFKELQEFINRNKNKTRRSVASVASNEPYIAEHYEIPKNNYSNKLNDINKLVPIIKQTIRKNKENLHIAQFKTHLLDIYLTYLLETEYPHIPKTEYEIAKKQQMDKEKRILLYENQLYNLYKENELDHIILSRLDFIPFQKPHTRSITSRGEAPRTQQTTKHTVIGNVEKDIKTQKKNTLSVSERHESQIDKTSWQALHKTNTSRIDNIASIENSWTAQRIPRAQKARQAQQERRIQRQEQEQEYEQEQKYERQQIRESKLKDVYNISNTLLDPTYISPIKINKKIYKSPVHYAYNQLFLTLGITINTDLFSDYVELRDVYNTSKEKWIKETLKTNNQKAILEKFKNPTLYSILQVTKPNTLVWFDKSDPILGATKEAGDNLSGRSLMYFRDNENEITKEDIQRERIVSYNNIWVQHWVINQSRDYQNTLRLIFNNQTDLQKLYKKYLIKLTKGILRITNKEVSAGTLATLHRYFESTFKHLTVRWKLLEPLYNEYITERNLYFTKKTQSLTTIYNIQLLEQYLNNQPDEDIKMLLKKSGLTSWEILMIFPIINYQFETSMKNKLFIDVFNHVVKTNNTLTKKPTPDMVIKAKSKLTHFYNTLNINEHINKTEFISSILAGKNTNLIHELFNQIIKNYNTSSNVDKTSLLKSLGLSEYIPETEFQSSILDRKNNALNQVKNDAKWEKINFWGTM